MNAHELTVKDILFGKSERGVPDEIDKLCIKAIMKAATLSISSSSASASMLAASTALSWAQAKR